MPGFLGIDYGLERIGLAISIDNKIAFPLCVLSLRKYGCRTSLLDAVANVAREHNVEGIVIGLPLNADGSENLTCRQIRNVIVRLKRRLTLPFYWISEELSSSEAEHNLKYAGIKKIKAVLDQEAARLILQSFLNLPQNRRILA